MYNTITLKSYFISLINNKNLNSKNLLNTTSKNYIYCLQKELKATTVGNTYCNSMSDNSYYVNLIKKTGQSGDTVGVTFYFLLKFIYLLHPFIITPRENKRCYLCL